ncbi:TPM domain-containing protein [Actinokineospora sp. HUAS TT18]|uniref:TPM domain-containing protein n=1 Tax=Actinokineospora sp. HUAS TT18 TaxID=3447451 RepID=UPI003F528C8F
MPTAPPPARLLRWSAAAALALFALVASPAAADPPERLRGQLTDNSGALDAGGRASAQAAIDKLYDSRKIRLWVVFVEDFTGEQGPRWAEDTAALSSLGDRDVLLAVATVDRSYGLYSAGLPQEVSDNEFTELRVDSIEPALRSQDWAGAVVAAADGLDGAMAPDTVSARPLIIGGAVVLLGGGGVYLYTRRRKRARADADIAAAREIDPNDTAALAALPVDALDARSKEVLVEMDNALRTSAEELDLARGEFGDAPTQPFTTAFTAAKEALAHAFTLRQRLDDNVPETPEQQRDLLIELISSCGKADKELDARVAEFDGMRDLLIDAPQRLDALTQDMVALTTRVPESEATLTRLATEFPADVLSPIRDNVTHARQRLDFADQNITAGREATARPAGEQGAVVAAIRAAEGAVGQARTLLDAVDHGAENIRAAIASLPAAIEDTRADLDTARGLAEHGGPTLATAVAAAQSALELAEVAKDTNPLGAYTDLAAADVELDKAISTAATAKDRTDRLRQQVDQTLTAARAQVSAVADYIGTRRGAVEAEARTRLSEAQRHLDEAERATDLSVALQHARTAADLAARASSAAEADVRNWETKQRQSTFGGNSGAVLGGIILDSVLRGGFGSGSRGGRWGGGGGSGPGSFGGAGSSRRIGGGGRF